MFGWRGRLLRVNLTGGTVTRELLDPGAARNYLGGRGLGTYLHSREVPRSLTPRDPGNHLVLVTGPLTGTLAPNGGRYTLVTRTLPAGRIAAASIGGRLGPELKFAGFDGVIFEGKAAEPVYLWVNNGKAELRPATHLRGKRVRETTELLLKETDERAAVSCIGPAGENGVDGSVVVSDSWSAAGASGLGIAMGAKNLKAVAVSGTEGFRVADHDRFLKIALELRAWMKTRPIAARGSRAGDSVFLVDNVTWDSTPPDCRPARTQGCFGCAVSFSSFSSKNNEGFLALSAGSPPGELKERLAEYRLFTDLGLDFAAGKAKTAFPGDGAEGEQAALALKLARGEGSGRTVSGCSAGDICAEAPGPVIDRGACIAGGYAVVPRIPAGNGGGEAASDLIAVLDSAGLCPYLAAGIDTGIIAELLTAATGIQFSRDKVMQAGRRINRFIRQA